MRTHSFMGDSINTFMMLLSQGPKHLLLGSTYQHYPGRKVLVETSHAQAIALPIRKTAMK